MQNNLKIANLESVPLTTVEYKKIRKEAKYKLVMPKTPNFIRTGFSG